MQFFLLLFLLFIYYFFFYRFVNYVNEICQTNYKFKSIASAVSDVGIPQWVVDIRHGATHSHLPSLENLRQAAQYCRNWLWFITDSRNKNQKKKNEFKKKKKERDCLTVTDCLTESKSMVTKLIILFFFPTNSLSIISRIATLIIIIITHHLSLLSFK
ncbi:unnamed protein product [Brugia pahangi]|uniref:Uncharacterized protein n=1 Tax=Brugia pahangi TaxID=6280 RepID=A0A0N4TCG7_BRUPA|nr:unnamed protein product [Brugia pahangi]